MSLLTAMGVLLLAAGLAGCACGDRRPCREDRAPRGPGEPVDFSRMTAPAGPTNLLHAGVPAPTLNLNLEAPRILGVAALDSVLAAEAGLPRAERLGRWARRFLAAETEYRFGLAEGGYVSEGLIVDDRHLDCVSLMYRCSELSAARDRVDAFRIAFATRFAGAAPLSVVDETGRVDYDDPSHLDYSLDMIRTGLWGRDVTAELSGARLDETGSSRYPPRSFFYLPEAELRESDLREGDVAWLVLSPEHAGARKLRDEHGPVIGHIGLIIVEEGRPWLVHAASSGLEGYYEGGRVAAAPLAVYLERVERYDGVVITRF